MEVNQIRPTEKLMPNRLAQITIATLSVLIAAGCAALFSFNGNWAGGIAAGAVVGLVVFVATARTFANVRRRRRE